MKKTSKPGQYHTGQADMILENRRQVYADARAKTPLRWRKHTRPWILSQEAWLKLDVHNRLRLADEIAPGEQILQLTLGCAASVDGSWTVVMLDKDVPVVFQ